MNLSPAARDAGMLAAVLAAMWGAVFAADAALRPAREHGGPGPARTMKAPPAELFRALDLGAIARGQPVSAAAAAEFARALDDPETRALLIEIADGILARPLGPAERETARVLLESWDRTEPATRERVPADLRARVDRLRERLQ